MNFLGLGPGELLLIAIIALVVVGPERMPELARRGGQFLVSVRNWVRASPDAAMVLRMRQEIESELATLRSSLAEVQNVRDEIVGAAKQVTQTVQDDLVKPMQQVSETVNAIPRTRSRSLTVDQTLAPQPAEDGAPLPTTDPAVADDAVALGDAPEPQIAPPGFSQTVAPALETTSLSDTVVEPQIAPPGFSQTVAPVLETTSLSDTVVEPQIAPPGFGRSGEPQPVEDPERAALLAEIGRLNHRLDDLATDVRAMQEMLRQREAAAAARGAQS